MSGEKGMMMVFMLMATMTGLSPLKMATLLTMMSLWTASQVYFMTSSVFYVSSLIICFSSGMMILMTYSASMANQETINKKTKSMITLLMLTALVSMETQKTSSMMNMMEFKETVSMMLMMAFMIMCMKAINSCITEKSMSMKKNLYGEKEFSTQSP